MEEDKTNINWYPGHMAKAKRLIIEDLKLVDVVIEILDSRIPISSQNPEINQIIKDKKRIIILNKSDLANENENKKWIQFFKEKGIKAILTDSNSGRGINEVIREAENIMKDELEKLAQKGRVGRTIRVLILGIPNVGKSSFINRVAKRVSAEVGNKPGVTKKNKWIRVNEKIELLDTPGVLWPKFESEEVALNLSYTGTIKDEILEITEIAFYLLKKLIKEYPTNLCDRYKLDINEIDEIMKNNEENEAVYEILKIIAKKRGAFISGGNINEEKISRIIIDEFRSGKIGKITLEKAGK